MIKQLCEKKVKTQSLFPAQLKMYLDSGVKTYTALAEAAPVGNLWKELLNNWWETAQTKASGSSTMSNADLQVFVQGVK